MSSQQLCPWCDTEIVWDDEIGPEESCPHCGNELGDYKTVTYALDRDEDLRPVTEDYAEMADAYSDEASRGSECSFCGEETIIVGQKKVGEDEFIPRKSKQMNVTLLEAPFTMDVAMCPSCLQISFSLSDESRKKMEKRWRSET